MKDMSKEVEALAKKMEEALGKRGAQSVEDLEEAAEKGTNKIASYFKNLGQRVKEDMRTAFDMTGIKVGSALMKDLAGGVKQVFEMEKAFDRLNTRLQLSTKQLMDFKKEVGRKVAATGSEMKDIMPGMETVASRGNVKDSKQLSSIAETLGKAKQVTGEDTTGLSESIVEIIKNQGQKVTASTFQKAMDAVQGTRTAGAFKSAGEAADAIKNVTQGLSASQMQKMGIDTRTAGGLAATASKGEGGQEVLRHILEMAAKPGQQQLINTMLGAGVFKGGKLQADQLKNINTGHLGKEQEAVLASTLGTDQAGLQRFIQSFKSGMGEFAKVTSGSDETATQFEEATSNLASKIEQMKTKMKQAGLEIGSSVSNLGNDILSGHMGKIGGDAKDLGKTLWENKGQIAGAGALSVGAGMLMGGGMNSLIRKLPGGGMLAGAAGMAGAKAAGITPVYVTNAADIGGGGSGALSTGGVGGKVGQAGALLAAAAIGYEVGQVLLKMFPSLGTAGGDYVADKIYGSDKEVSDTASAKQMDKNREKFNSTNGMNLTPEEYAKAVETGTLKALKAAKTGEKVHYTNPSDVTGRGKAM